MIKTIKNPGFGVSALGLDIMSEGQWTKLLIQKKISKVEQEIGVPVTDCMCSRCKYARGLINELIGIGFDLGVNEFEYEESVKKHQWVDWSEPNEY